MRALKSIIIGAVVAWLSLACAAGPSPAQPAQPQAAGPGPGEAAQPKRGGILQYAVSTEAGTLHPHKGSSTPILRHTGAGYETLLSFLYEPGQDYRRKLEVVPKLAERWQQPDDTTYIFSIRKGVKWHDGVDFTAADVAFTFDWIRKEKFAASGRLAQVDTYEVLDPYTLKIKLKAPTPDFLNELAERNLLIVPKHVVERGDDLNKVLIGTGPFKIKSFRSGVESIWERNNDYWQPGRPYMEGVRQIWGLDSSGMAAAFIAGENDLLTASDLAQLQPILNVRPQAGLFPWQTDTGGGLFLKLDQPPFNDVRVRRALHLAVDRQAMIVTLSPGVPLEKALYGIPGIWAGRGGWAIPQEELRKLPGYRQPKDQDIAEAKRLLAEAGYPEGLSFDINYDMSSIAPAKRSEMLPTFFRAVGIRANLKGMEQGVYAKAQDSGEWQGALMGGSVNSIFRGLYEYFHSKGASNNFGLNDAKLDALIEATLTGKDVEARKRAARQMQEYFLEQAYFISTIEGDLGVLYQPWVHDFTHGAGAILTLHGDSYPMMWLDVEAMPASRR